MQDHLSGAWCHPQWLGRPISMNNQDHSPLQTHPQITLIWAIALLALPSQVSLGRVRLAATAKKEARQTGKNRQSMSRFKALTTVLLLIPDRHVSRGSCLWSSDSASCLAPYRFLCLRFSFVLLLLSIWLWWVWAQFSFNRSYFFYELFEMVSVGFY